MRWVRVGFVPVSVLILVAAALVVPLPFYVEQPGRVLSLGACVDVDPQEGDGRVGGDYLLTTINVMPATFVDTLLAAVDPDADLVRQATIIPPGMDSRTFFREQRSEFRTTAHVAAAVGLRSAGESVSIVGGEVRVVHVAPNTPAEGLLHPGDVITAVDEEPVRTDGELRAAIRAYRGDAPLRLSVERDGQDVEVEVTPATVGGTPVIGVVPQTVNLQVETAVSVEVLSGSIGGPSAGLMIALTVYDKVEAAVDVAGGRVVAGTGTINWAGDVGPVGGVGLKVVAADRLGASVFLTPRADFAAAQEWLPDGSDMRVVPVDTFEEAKDALLRDAGARSDPAAEPGECPHGRQTG